MGSVDHLMPKTHVIGVVSNPVRYKSRYRLAKEFMARMPPWFENFWVIEVQQGERDFVVTDPNNKRHIQKRTEDELWIKENMQNLVVQQLPDDWEYIITVDMDIEWQRHDWIEETVQQLQNYNVVQCFQTAIEMGPDGESLQTHKGFGWSYVTGLPFGKDYSFWHPGYAWGWCRTALAGWGGGGMGDSLGGPFISGAILGAADHHMALAMIGRGGQSYPSNVSDGYKRMINKWQERAEKNIFRDIGYVPGTILHHWHGKKKDRKYVERWDILTKEYPQGKYDPYEDLIMGWNGLYMLDNTNVELRDNVRSYMRARNEDSIDLD